MELLIAILITYGITNIVTQGSIFYTFREWFLPKSFKNKWYSSLCGWIYKLLNCPMCFGFWVGAIVGIFYGPCIYWNIIFNGGLYSGTTWIIFCFTQFLGQGYDPSRTFNVLFQNELTHKTINNNEANAPQKQEV